MDIFTRLDHAVHKVSRVQAQAEATAVRGLGPSRAPRRRQVIGNVTALVQQLPDDAVAQLLWQAGEVRRSADALIAVAAAEIRSRADARLDVPALAGISDAEAERLAAVGAMVAESEAAIDARDVVEATDLEVPIDMPWWHPIAIAVVEGRLSAASAASAREGLGEPGAHVTEQALSDAAERLVCSLTAAAPDAAAEAARRERAALEGALLLLPEPTVADADHARRGHG
ncbi:hypothetical protein [Paramicrobacterium humi]|nr:hypothetical protein [Microbacterium humi]